MSEYIIRVADWKLDRVREVLSGYTEFRLVDIQPPGCDDGGWPLRDACG